MSVLITMNYFQMSEKYFQFRRYYQGNFFADHVTGFSHFGIIFRAMYVKDLYKTLKRIGKIQFVLELTNLSNVQISKFHRSLHVSKKKN